MKQKTVKVLSFLICLVLLVGMLPLGGKAATTDAAELKAQIKALYEKCLYTSGKTTFSSQCGAFVSWELYNLGITTTVVGGDGNDHYDNFKNQKYSTGGCRIEAYPDTEYDLLEAINAITENGTRDVYNLMVGFHKTNTALGQKYGHAMLINAIIDGVVYFCESFDHTVAGKKYAEGTVITCTIREFADAYNARMIFEGIIHFGLTTYAEYGTFYPASFGGEVEAAAEIYSEPCLPGVDDRSRLLRTAQPGERLTVVGLYHTPEGEYWYELQGSERAYIRADKTKRLAMCYTDVVVTDAVAPAEIRKGNGFDIKGQVRAKNNTITNLRGQIFKNNSGTLETVQTESVEVTGNSYTLSKSTLSNNLAFRKLEAGDYRYELSAVVKSHYYENGKVQTSWQTVKLWSADFRVVTKTGTTYKLELYANGGVAEVNSLQVSKDSALETLPEILREGYAFDGWYTADGVKVAPGYVVSSSQTLYARWKTLSGFTGWRLEEGRWVYLENGRPKDGFVEDGGKVYYMDIDRQLLTGWAIIDGRKYYFNGGGDLHTGWLETGKGKYYCTRSGVLTGTHEIDGVTYTFTGGGVLIS